MSPIICPKCGSYEHSGGYGFAAGPLAAYTFCDGCGVMLEFCPDLEGVHEELAQKIMESVEKWRREVWGTER